MDFWAENQGHLSQFNKFNTIPSRICTQNYPDRQLASPFPVYYGDQQHKTIHSAYWPSQDVPNWANQEAAGMTSSQNFPFSFGHPIQRHYSDVGEHQRQEARDWTSYQQQQERGMQHEGWFYNSAHCKRDLSKKNESNFRELEAWALRYSHSLPRRRRIEAELRGTRQDNIERQGMQMLTMQDLTQWNRASRKQAPSHCQNTSASSTFDAKDKLSYQTKLYSHLPNYNAPPPYSVQLKSVSVAQKSENQNFKSQQILKQHEREVFEKCPPKIETQELGNKLTVQGRANNEATKVIEGRKFKLNKKAGGLTIFCLVSRIADTERESLPVLQNQTTVVQPKNSNANQSRKLADEVDFKIQTPPKHTRSPYSKLQAIPICKESLSKMAEKSVPKTNEASAYEKLAVQSKYPLWRRPSFTGNTESDGTPPSCSKNILESNLKDKENDSKPCCKTDKVKTQGAKNDAMLMIDTTCVVVKLEVLQGPKMEQVQYLSSEEQSKSRRNLDNATEDDQSVIKQGEDFQTLLKQEAKGNDDEDKSEDILAANTTLLSETLEERAKRICGLRDTTMMQMKEEECVDMSVEVFPMLKRDVSDKELQEGSTISQNENMQPGEVRIGKNGVSGEVGDSEDSGIKKMCDDLETESKVQSLKVADDQKEESNAEVTSGPCVEPVEISHSSEVLNKLLLRNKGKDEQVLPTQRENQLQVKTQNDEGFAEVNEDAKTFGDSEYNPMETTINATFSDDNLDFQDKNQDQEAVEEFVEGDFDGQNTIKEVPSSELGELSGVELEFSRRDYVSCDNSDGSDGAKDIKAMVQANLQHLDSGQVEERPVLGILSESEQSQDKLTEEIQEQMHINNKVEPEFEVDKNTDKNIDIANSDLEIQGIAGKVTEIHDWQKEDKSDATKDKDCGKGQSEVTKKVQTNFLDSVFKDFKQETLQDLTDGLRGLVQSGFQTKEKGLYEEDKFDKTLPRVNAHENQSEQSHLIDPRVKSLSNDVKPSQDKEVKEEGHPSCTDMSHTDNKHIMENDQEDEVCRDKSPILKEITEKTQKEEFQAPEMAAATCIKETPEDTVLLVADEPEIQKETDLKQQYLVVIDKIEVPDCNFQDSDLQQCECGDPTSPSSVNEKEFIRDEDKNDQDAKMDQSTNKEIGESSLVCLPDPNVSHQATIMERSSSSTDHSQLSIPSTSMCNNFENTSCGDEGNYPKSLWDAVSRIRKHTAPDSENEEEEVMENWDKESLADNVVSFDKVLDKGYLDLPEGMQVDEFYEDSNAQDDTLSQCSNSSQGSDGTIVDEELEEVTNTDLDGVSNENQGSDGEEKCGNMSHNGETAGLNEEEFDEETEMSDQITL